MLIVLEGLPGSGKSTQSQMLVKHFEALGKKVELFHFPTTIHKQSTTYCYEFIQDQLQYGSCKDPITVARMFLVNMYPLVNLLRGRIEDPQHVIIFDRYYYSTRAIHGAQTKNDREEINFYENLNISIKCNNLPTPDFAFYLSVSLDYSRGIVNKKSRNKEKGENSNYVNMKLKNLWCVKGEYLGMISSRWEKLVSINCMEDSSKVIPVKDVTAKILDYINSGLKKSE